MMVFIGGNLQTCWGPFVSENGRSLRFISSSIMWFVLPLIKQRHLFAYIHVCFFFSFLIAVIFVFDIALLFIKAPVPVPHKKKTASTLYKLVSTRKLLQLQRPGQNGQLQLQPTPIQPSNSCQHRKRTFNDGDNDIFFLCYRLLSYIPIHQFNKCLN